MNYFLINILLTFLWLALTGNFHYTNFIVGFLFSYFTLWISTGFRADKKYFTRFPKIVGFFLYFLWEFIKANAQIIYDILTPKPHMNPGIIAVPLTAKKPVEITLLATLITLTPGSLVIDVSSDNKIMYIHTMYLSTREEFIMYIKSGFEKRLLEIMS